MLYLSLLGEILLVYLLTISVISFFAIVVDKILAIKTCRRISEKALFIMALLGGSAFMYFAMCIFHHKTQKNRFVFGIPLIFAVQCVILFIVYRTMY